MSIRILQGDCRELDAALLPIARKHFLSVGSLIKLAKVAGGAQA